jgi:hypothetical protein
MQNWAYSRIASPKLSASSKPNKSYSRGCVAEAPTREAEGALRTYASSLRHLLTHERKLKEDAVAKRAKQNSRAGAQRPNCLPG